MPNVINGLPAHILLVHAVVVIIPLAALLAVVGAVWPAARRRLGVITPLLALAGLVFVPLATDAGEWLEERVPESALVERHAELGDGLLVWGMLLFVTATLFWLPDLAAQRSWTTPALVSARWVRPVLGVLLAASAVVAVVQVYRIGDSGAKASWNGRYSTTGGG